MELLLIIIGIVVVIFSYFILHNYSHKKLLLIVLCIVISLFFLFQYRHFYEVNDITFTIWKTKNGCYITPYRYLGLTLPQNDYIKTGNLGEVLIAIDKDTTLLIFNDCYTDGISVECVLSKYRYQYFSPSLSGRTLKEVNLFHTRRKTCFELNLPVISMDIKEMYVRITNNN
jgi:surface polysaccharide O-acyltransferase-like enzyme